MSTTAKKAIGVIVLGSIIAILLFFVYSTITGSNEEISPLPQDNSVNVIFVTPEGTPPLSP